MRTDPPSPLDAGGPRWGNPEHDRRRYTITWILLGLSALFTVAVIVAAWVGPEDSWGRMSSQVGFLLTPFHTLLGIAIGYYFADKANEANKKK